jgi:hypothetical protein
MTTDTVRAAVYACFVAGEEPTVAAIARHAGMPGTEVGTALAALADEHRLALAEDGSVLMAHPFSAVPTGYRAEVGDRVWHANCAWDALAILALMGDGVATKDGDLLWSIDGGTVSPPGVVHFVVPAREFWADIGFT